MKRIPSKPRTFNKRWRNFLEWRADRHTEKARKLRERVKAMTPKRNGPSP